MCTCTTAAVMCVLYIILTGTISNNTCGTWGRVCTSYRAVYRYSSLTHDSCSCCWCCVGGGGGHVYTCNWLLGCADIEIVCPSAHVWCDGMVNYGIPPCIVRCWEKLIVCERERECVYTWWFIHCAWSIVLYIPPCYWPNCVWLCFE